MARPRFHILVTAPVATLTYRRWGLGAALGLTATGIFVDLDHLADYLWVRWQGHRTQFLAPLHAWELVAAGAGLAFWLRRRRPRPAAPSQTPGLASMESVLSGLLAGLVLHLVQDVIANRPRHAGVYAFAYRLRHGFDRDRVGWENHKTFHDWSGKPWYTWL